MKKIIPLLYLLILIIMIIFSINMSITYANQGCCSWHGGISHCGSNGRYVCNDGTYSSSCTCNSYKFDDNYNSTTYCKNLEEKIKKLENENEILKDDNETKENWILILFFGMGGYIIYKNIKNVLV